MKEIRDINILAIETSCDETAAAVVRDGRTVLSDIFSSLAMVGMAGQHTPSRFALPRRYRYTAMARLGRSL